MKPELVLKHEFVEFVPDELKERTLYVSMQYKTVVHLCFCGCRHQVVTPLAPTAWKLTFDGVSISLWPSIGSWRLPCQSHYIINSGKVVWAERWPKEWIDAGRAAEARARDEYYGNPEPKPPALVKPKAEPPATTKPDKVPRQDGFWKRLWKGMFE